MPKALESWCVAPLFQVLFKGWVAQVDPADDTEYPRVLSRHFQQRVGFLLAGAGLHGNAAIQAGSVEQWPQIVWEKVPPQVSLSRTDPRIISGPVAPEMLVRIEPQG
jgi:hypothetical protein